MRLSVLHYLAWVSAVFPVIAGARWALRLPKPRVAVLCWALMLIFANGLALFLGARGLNNHWVIYLSTPLSGVAVVVALIAWQVRDTPRLILRVMVPLYLVAWTVIVALIEDIHTFSVVAGPFSSLILLVAASCTLVGRSLHSLDPHTKQDWFWITIGFLIFYGVETGLPPLALLLVRSHPDLLDLAFQVRAAGMIVAMVLIAWGMLCPLPLPQSGGSSSRSASPSLSLPPLSG